MVVQVPEQDIKNHTVKKECFIIVLNQINNDLETKMNQIKNSYDIRNTYNGFVCDVCDRPSSFLMKVYYDDVQLYLCTDCYSSLPIQWCEECNESFIDDEIKTRCPICSKKKKKHSKK